MKVKAGLSKPKHVRKSLPGAIEKKKFSKPTGGVLKNVVKITDAFEDLKTGNEPTGISCSKMLKAVKKTASGASIKAKKTDVKTPKTSVASVKKNSEKPVVVPKQKKPKKEKVDSVPKISLKSKILESNSTTEVNTNVEDPKLDVNKVHFQKFTIIIFIFL